MSTVNNVPDELERMIDDAEADNRVAQNRSLESSIFMKKNYKKIMKAIEKNISTMARAGYDWCGDLDKCVTPVTVSSSRKSTTVNYDDDELNTVDGRSAESNYVYKFHRTVLMKKVKHLEKMAGIFYKTCQSIESDIELLLDNSDELGLMKKIHIRRLKLYFNDIYTLKSPASIESYFMINALGDIDAMVVEPTDCEFISELADKYESDYPAYSGSMFNYTTRRKII